LLSYQSLERTRPTPEAKFTAIFHDWGSLAGLMFTNRANVWKMTRLNIIITLSPDQVVLFDVCLVTAPEP
jgi:hypothetical protein